MPCGSSPLIVSFPTEKETFLGFLVQGPYRTTPARDNVPGHDPSNQFLVRETGTLLGDVLRELRDDGLLTVEALQTLPLEETRFPAGSMFRPLFDAVGEILTTEAMIPVAGGGYGVAVDLELAGGAGVPELLDPDQLGALCGAGRPVRFADASITEHLAPALWRYLRDEIGIDEVTPAEVVARVTREFLEAQADEWITRFYAFLYYNSSEWEAARAAPVIRLEDGSHVAPFDGQGRLAVYLPGPVASSLPTVRRAIAGCPGGPPVPRGAEPGRAGRGGRGPADRAPQVRRARGGGARGGGARSGPARRRRRVRRAGAGRGDVPASGRNCWSACGRPPS